MQQEPQQMVVANEFAEVVLTRVHTRNGVRLRLSSPRSGASIDLDALELEALSKQTHEVLSKILAAAIPQGGGASAPGGAR